MERLDIEAIKKALDEATPKPLDEWHEDYGDALWWEFPVAELPYVGSPLDSDWPDYHTHWTPIVEPEKQVELLRTLLEENERLEIQAHINSVQIEALNEMKEEITQLREANKQLEQEIAECDKRAKDAIQRHLDSEVKALELANTMTTRAIKAEQERDAHKKALEWYADKTNWKARERCGNCGHQIEIEEESAEFDIGGQARTILSQYKGAEKE